MTLGKAGVALAALASVIALARPAADPGGGLKEPAEAPRPPTALAAAEPAASTPGIDIPRGEETFERRVLPADEASPPEELSVLLPESKERDG